MVKKGKLSAEGKVKIVQRYMRGEVILKGGAASVGVEDTALTDWLRTYRSEGVSGLGAAEKNWSYSPTLKERAAKEYLSGAGS